MGPSGSACPQTCKRQKSIPIAEKQSYECFCDGCPEDMDETRERYEKFVENEIHQNGLYILATIARHAGLKYPNRRMKELMDERNRRIMATLKSGKTLGQKEKEVNQINEEYVTKIEQAALLGPDPPQEEKKKDEEDGPSKNVLLIIAIVALAVAVIAVVGGCYLVRKYKKASATVVKDLSVKSAEDIRAAAEQLQQANDNMTVVIGNPVPGGGTTGSTTQGAATGGVPQAPKTVT